MLNEQEYIFVTVNAAFLSLRSYLQRECFSVKALSRLPRNLVTYNFKMSYII